MRTNQRKTGPSARRARVDELAKWLNRVCVDWAPIGFDWDASRPGNAARRKTMRALAVEAMTIAEGRA